MDRDRGTEADAERFSFGGAIRSFKRLPSTLTTQYHFTNFAGVKPYLGADINYTRLGSVNLPDGMTADCISFGPALQVGTDVPLAKKLYLNCNLKKAYIRTDVSVGGSKAGTFKVDPVLDGVGLGWRF